MTNSDTPAGTTGGPVTLSGLDDLPEKLRVHALAKLLGRTSREVMAALLDLGFAARSVQSSVDRKTAEQVAVVFVPELAGAPATPPEEVPRVPAGEQPAVVDESPGTAEEPAAVLAPLFAPPAPIFQPPVRRGGLGRGTAGLTTASGAADRLVRRRLVVGGLVGGLGGGLGSGTA
ncbi:MAG TPA: translation initiation factor IF-2 N-terminal domain-containing protein, partial [Pseudonocardia sp.]|nr:translation initiation factor IF-2 N-terminal domain-containing protein [Pseudonocardia sp.]